MASLSRRCVVAALMTRCSAPWRRWNRCGSGAPVSRSYERVGRGGQPLQLLGSLADHADELLAIVDTGLVKLQQLVRPGCGRHVEREDRTVPIGRHTLKQLIEHPVRDRSRLGAWNPLPVDRAAKGSIGL